MAANSTKLSQTLEAWRKVRVLRPEVRFTSGLRRGRCRSCRAGVCTACQPRHADRVHLRCCTVRKFENAPGLVTADKHGHLFRDPGAYKIPDAGSPQVVEKPVNTSCPYGLLPSFSDVHHLMATPYGFAAWVHAALPEKYPWGIRAHRLLTPLLVRQHVMQVIARPPRGMIRGSPGLVWSSRRRTARPSRST